VGGGSVSHGLGYEAPVSTGPAHFVDDVARCFEDCFAVLEGASFDFAFAGRASRRVPDVGAVPCHGECECLFRGCK